MPCKCDTSLFERLSDIGVAVLHSNKPKTALYSPHAFL
jgi:hypothetical protein